MDERLKRIAEMEERLNRIKEWLKDETLDSVEDDVRVLDAYYRSPLCLSGSGIDGERQSPASRIHYRSAIACMSMTVRKKVFRSGCV